MKLWALGDPHLSFSQDKPMDVFGPHWKNHHRKLRESWTELVGDRDWVLVPGDVSWAMRLDEALPDLRWIGRLPGRKAMVKGNHDYWWSSLAKVRNALPKGMHAIQNDALDTGWWVLAGARGWLCPGSEEYDPERDPKYVERELGRLELSLRAAVAISGGERPVATMMHYPPVIGGEGTPFSELLASYGVRLCAYGHLHSSENWSPDVDMELNGVTYRLVSADYVGFRPRLLASTTGSPKSSP
ncbi:hypothetical protein GF402_10405 [Candidatus Fermentibacteria bacterium]|nr:hypothetical protein [Candidatus Fermentibacteria bacterium]